MQDQNTLLFAYWENGVRCDMTDQEICETVQWTAADLDYLCKRGISIERIDTYSLGIGRACTLALTGYLSTQIQKVGS